MDFSCSLCTKLGFGLTGVDSRLGYRCVYLCSTFSLRFQLRTILIEALTVMTNWRESSSQMCSKHVAALAAAGLARGRRTAVLGRTACCSHTEFGSGLARLQSAYA